MRVNRAKAPWGYRRVKVTEAHGALVQIDATLYEFVNQFKELFPFQYAVRSNMNSDGSVDGEVSITGFEHFKEWNVFFFSLSGFNKWPKAIGAVRGESEVGDFWTSVNWQFTVPDGRKWRELEQRYERNRGGWGTSTHWRHSNNMPAAFIDIAHWGKEKGKGRSVTELLEQKKYGYKVQSLTVRLTWSPENEKPNWR